MDGRRNWLRIGLGLGQRRTLTTEEEKASDFLDSDSMWGEKQAEFTNYEYRSICS